MTLQEVVCDEFHSRKKRKTNVAVLSLNFSRACKRQARAVLEGRNETAQSIMTNLEHDGKDNDTTGMDSRRIHNKDKRITDLTIDTCRVA
jgi:hypothetical protein